MKKNVGNEDIMDMEKSGKINGNINILDYGKRKEIC